MNFQVFVYEQQLSDAEAQVAALRTTTGNASPLRALMVTQLNDLGILQGFENLMIVSLSDPEQAGIVGSWARRQ